MTAEAPYTRRQRRSRRFVDNGFGHRPTNSWGSGNLPAPWAEGDLVEVVEPNDRTAKLVGRHFVVSYVTSIGEGDEWYVRITDGDHDCAGRLHISFVGRRSGNWVNPEQDMDFMSGVRLVDCADPEGLAKRERMLAEGWTYVEAEHCPTCGHRLPRPMAAGEST